MIILPAIDIKDGICVRLFKGDYSTAHKVAENPLDTAKSFEAAGAEWIHMVDLDGAKDSAPKNSEIFFDIAKNTNLKVEVGGGIRTMETVDRYIQNGISRVILGSSALKNPDFVKKAVEKYAEKIAVGIDARDGFVSLEGWLENSTVSYLELARKMEEIGVKTIIFTDISRDGMLKGPNFEQLDEINRHVTCDIIASGGVSSLEDISKLRALGLYGSICGKAIYTGDIDLARAIINTSDLTVYFQKNELIPAIIQDFKTSEVLMLAYMNEESFRRTLETGFTWFFSRSRQELWNKGATSGHIQEVVSINSDCDNDTLLIRVKQTGAACHTGSHSCFFREVL